MSKGTNHINGSMVRNLGFFCMICWDVPVCLMKSGNHEVVPFCLFTGPIFSLWKLKQLARVTKNALSWLWNMQENIVSSLIVESWCCLTTLHPINSRFERVSSMIETRYPTWASKWPGRACAQALAPVDSCQTNRSRCGARRGSQRSTMCRQKICCCRSGCWWKNRHGGSQTALHWRNEGKTAARGLLVFEVSTVSNHFSHLFEYPFFQRTLMHTEIAWSMSLWPLSCPSYLSISFLSYPLPKTRTYKSPKPSVSWSAQGLSPGPAPNDGLGVVVVTGHWRVNIGSAVKGTWQA